MNLFATCTISALLLVGMTEPLFAELFLVARLTDLRGNPSFQVCTEADKRKIESELGEESKALPKVIVEAKTEWAKSLKVEAFPTTRIKPRTFKVINTALSREAADNLLVQAKVREMRLLAEDKAEEERVLKARSGGQGRGHRVAVVDQKQDVREDRERDDVADKAEFIVRQKLAVAVGHAVPFYGVAPYEPKTDGRNNKKKK